MKTVYETCKKKGWGWLLSYTALLTVLSIITFSCSKPGKLELAGLQQQEETSTMEVLEDHDISLAVKRELALQRGIFGDIEVTTKEGIVTLSGSTKNILTLDRATQVAQMIKGVRAVINQIELDVTPVPDQKIEDQIELAFYWDPALESHEIKVEVRDGIVNLYGTVDSWEEKELASLVAKGVEGVKALNNNIVFNFVADRSDTEIAEEIIENLRWDVLVDDALIEVIVKDGKVKLIGTVGSAAEKSQAKVSAWVTGVESVDVDQLKVARWARDRELSAGKYEPKPDDEIKEAVLSAFLHDPRIHTVNPDVTVEDGVVTLTGSVPDRRALQAAESDAYNVVGVVRVENQLTVEPTIAKTDEEIEDRIENAIFWDPVLEDYQIDVSVEDGVAKLEGEVDSYYEKYKAAELAANTQGVTNVDDELEVTEWSTYHYDRDYYYYHHEHGDQPLPGLSDQEIQDAIEAQLFWSPYVNQDNVIVSVSEGKATLSGTVGSEEERKQAEFEAYDGGAIGVENNLQVEKYELQP